MRMEAPIRACTTIGELTINDVSMHIDGAWNILNVQVLWIGNAVRAGNTIVAYDRGRLALPYRVDEASYQLQMVIDGTYDWLGNPYSDPWIGLETNVEYLWDNVFIPPDAPTATYPATLEMPSGEVRVADVQPRVNDLGATGTPTFVTTMILVVPHGRFEPEGS